MDAWLVPTSPPMGMMVSQREEFMTANEGFDSRLAPVDVGLTGGEVDQGDSAKKGPREERAAAGA